MHRQKLYISTILCYFLICKGEALATNLSDASATAQANNRNIKLEKIRLNSVKTEKTRAISEFLPNISANASYGQRNSFDQGQIMIDFYRLQEMLNRYNRHQFFLKILPEISAKY